MVNAMTSNSPAIRDGIPAASAKPLSLSLRLLVLLGALLSAGISPAAAGILVWPVSLTIAEGQKATSLWLENRGDSAKVMQLRVFSWSQRNGENRLDEQSVVVGSPPMMRIEAGTRQMVRLIHNAPLPIGEETAYRVIVDEIPSDADNASPSLARLHFQMRYSIPLFVASGDAAAHSPKNLQQQPVDTTALSWTTLEQAGKRWLEISNHGNRHVRLSGLTFTGASQASSSSSGGLAGYVLGGSRFRWSLPGNTTPGTATPLTGVIDGQAVTIARATE